MVEAMNPFEKVLDRLREKGWQKRGYGFKPGPNCLVGGVKVTKGINPQEWLGWDPDIERLAAIIQEQYPDRVKQYPDWVNGSTSTVPNFNDHPDTTFSDVERVLEKAAVKWEEERVVRDD